ncbi:MAG: hypothetical protein RBR54_09895 [Sulfurimonas sp.]|jgi:hypothetical protein|nr:hypothetical protein [Sulfurimonas sp.]
MDPILQECQELLEAQNIDSNSEIDFDVNGEVHTLSYAYITDTFMQASEESKLVFLRALQKAIEAENMGVKKFFEGMGQLLLMTHLSEKFDN